MQNRVIVPQSNRDVPILNILILREAYALRDAEVFAAALREVRP